MNIKAQKNNDKISLEINKQALVTMSIDDAEQLINDLIDLVAENLESPWED